MLLMMCSLQATHDRDEILHQLKITRLYWSQLKREWHWSSQKRAGPRSGYEGYTTGGPAKQRRHVICCLETDRLLVMVPEVLSELRPVQLGYVLPEEGSHS